VPHPRQLAFAKELALHRWRDEREGALRDVDALRDSESVAHTLVRDAWSPMPRLTVLHDPKLIAIVEEWKADVEVAGLSPEPVVDPDERLPEGSRATDDPPRGLLD
jgi:hypothetical protein